MTKVNLPYLQLQRLIMTTHTGAEAYNEEFHSGLNIIRGENSSGKSTIANFIFYVLGGDFTSWTKEALACKNVYAQVLINGTILTLNREVSSSSQRPLSIFWGTYENAKNQRDFGWNTYPYKYTETSGKESFSNVLFNAFGFPQSRNEDGGKITMHQILRLLYLDQDTPVQNLFRIESFDLPITRQAVAELLLGVYDDDLYSNRIKLRATRKLFDDKQRDVKSIKGAFAIAGNSVLRSDIEKNLKLVEETIKQLSEQIHTVKEAEFKKRRKSNPLAIESVQKEIIELNTKISKSIEKLNHLNSDLVDSKLFISTINKRIKAITESIIFKDTLGEMPLTHCPQCLSALELDASDEKNCSLCKNPLEEDEIMSSSLRIKQELQLQSEQSIRVLERKKKKKQVLEIELNELLEITRFKQIELDDFLKDSSSTRDIKLDELYTRKGSLESQYEYFIEQRKSVELIERLEEECAELGKKISILNGSIYSQEQAQANKFDEAKSNISKITKGILKTDLVRQSEFENPSKVNVDFRKDSFSLDDVNYFSASSNTLFKNAVSFSIFFSSLEKEFFRYPRFLLCDNIEDKGMEEARSKNFQRIIATISEASEVEHQIIMTTSMVDEQLNLNAELTVGDYYTHENRALNVHTKVPVSVSEEEPEMTT